MIDQSQSAREMVELLPCIRCGSLNIEIDCNGYNTFWIMCDGCGLEKNDLASREAAIDWWNIRLAAQAAPGEAMALSNLKKDFEIVRKASRLFENTSNAWMDRALKAEAALALFQTESKPSC